MDSGIIIGLSGKIGSGKDAAFSIIQKHFPSFVRVAFADKLKEIIYTLTGCRAYTREEKRVVPEGYTHTVGQLLQIVGETMKLVDVDVWVKALLNGLPLHSVIVDCRCENELKGIETRGGMVIRINGDPAGVRRENTDYPFSHVIENTGSLEDLERNILSIVAPYLSNKCILSSDTPPRSTQTTREGSIG